jgi:hypothetical protein
MSTRRGGIPGPESRTGLVRPAMSEAEFERRQALSVAASDGTEPETDAEPSTPRAATLPAASSGRSRASSMTTTRGKTAKPRRVQRMFAIEEDLDRKLWLYAIHIGKDRSEVVNDLLRPIVASMVLYDSRDRRSSSSSSAASRMASETEPPIDEEKAAS